MNLYSILMSDDVILEINNNLEYILNIIPEIKPMIGFDHKHPHHYLDVFNHTLYALSLSKKDFSIRMALLFHDISKPYCYVEKGGIRHYPNHPIYSEKITRIVLERLGYDKEFTEEVCYLVKYHDTPITKEDVEKDYNLQIKRYEVQRSDVLAHNPLMNSKRISYLIKTKKLFK